MHDDAQDAAAATLIDHARQTYARIVGALSEAAVRVSAVRRALWQQTRIWQAALVRAAPG